LKIGLHLICYHGLKGHQLIYQLLENIFIGDLN